MRFFSVFTCMFLGGCADLVPVVVIEEDTEKVIATVGEVYCSMGNDSHALDRVRGYFPSRRISKVEHECGKSVRVYFAKPEKICFRAPPKEPK